MGTIYVARSAKLSKWASDVGLSKHIFKVGYTEEPVKPVIEAGWAGETDWTLVKKEEAEGLDEDALIDRLARKVKMVDPNYYPRLRGIRGVFKVVPAHVENHFVIQQALATDPQKELSRGELKPKAADFATYLIHNALR
jgi:hypothetical protein